MLEPRNLERSQKTIFLPSLLSYKPSNKQQFKTDLSLIYIYVCVCVCVCVCVWSLQQEQTEYLVILHRWRG